MMTTNPYAIQMTPQGGPAAMQLAARAQAETLARYQLAHMVPRNPDVVRQDFLRLCKTPTFADRAEYSVPRGKSVTGPTIRFLEGLVQCTPHFDWTASVLAEEEEHRIIQVRATDLQSNRSESEDVVIRKVVERSSSAGREVLGQRTNSKGSMTYIVRATEDELEALVSARVSKAKRRTALRLMPRDLVDEGLFVAQETRRAQDAKHPDESRRRLVDGFASIGVPAAELAEYVGHDLASCSPAEMEDLRKLFQAIKGGDTSWAVEIKSVREERAPARTLDDLVGGAK